MKCNHRGSAGFYRKDLTLPRTEACFYNYYRSVGLYLNFWQAKYLLKKLL